MKTDYLELYTDYLISNSGFATATGLSAMMDNWLILNNLLFSASPFKVG
jgi:hypothetical protein